ncbi:MAG TPA: cobalt-precorrin 5A hydrolase [Clostridiaceae bacterium]|nr:cobalt-precorrin 5A hydrolase [Clostridiaceae bacterium]
MNIAVISFTDAASTIAARICSKMKNADMYDNRSCCRGVKSKIGSIFKTYDGIVFVCAAGIAVRMIAPYISDKRKDPAVVVVDDMGRFAISLLSGHIGGANDLARKISALIGAQAVITTASDSRGIESVDMFAKRCDLYIENMEDVKKITSIMVNKGAIRFITETSDIINYHNISDADFEGSIYVTSKGKEDFIRPCCILRPKNLMVGIGCKRGKIRDDILNAIYKVFKDNNLSIKSINAIASIDLKKDEKGIIETCKYLNCSFIVFSANDIKRVQDRFKKSAFVESKVGVTSVCEPCAYLAGGDIIVGKTCIDGVTVAVGRMI